MGFKNDTLNCATMVINYELFWWRNIINIIINLKVSFKGFRKISTTIIEFNNIIIMFIYNYTLLLKIFIYYIFQFRLREPACCVHRLK